MSVAGPHRPPPSHRPKDGLIGAGVLLAGLLGLWLWISMVSAPLHLVRSLTTAQDDIDKAKKAISAGGLKEARFYTFDATAKVDEARKSLGGPMLDLAGIISKVSGTIDELPHVVDAADYSAKAAHGTFRIARHALKGPHKIIEKDKTEKNGSVIDLERVKEVGDQIAKVRSNLSSARSALKAIDTSVVVHSLRKKVSSGISQADKAIALLDKAHAGFKLLPAILGGDGPRTYILAFQNSAEERGTGGAMLQFAVMKFDNGAPHMQRKTATVYQVDRNRRPLSIGLPADAWYVSGITDAQRFGNSNWSPDWPLSAKLMIDYGQASAVKGFPQHVDGMIGVDPTAAQQMMKGIGAFESPKANVRVSKDNLVNLLLFKAYASYPVTAVRRVVLHDIVKGFYDGMFAPKHPSDLVKGMGDALAEKHVQIWMANHGEERYIKRMHWDGGIKPPKHSDYSSIVEQNVGGNKLNYFEKRDFSLDVHIHGRSATDTARAAIYNGVDMPQPRWSMGDSGPFHHPMLNFYATKAANLTKSAGPPLSTTGDPVSKPVRIGSPPNLSWAGSSPPMHTEVGTHVWTGTLDIPPQQTGSIQMTYDVPGVVSSNGERMTYKLFLRQQPGVHAAGQIVTVHLPQGAHAVSGKGFAHKGNVWVWEKTLDSDRALSLSWTPGS